ncbi:glutathione S-transferase family protein [Pseudovibrio sp. JE062]|uniref:glutathione S-transferase family protein n=1 Tax=Pseudovibrio sp. JE062 TaxID=439495 RepID=UPI000186BFA2|nr:glutathione S-transferase [Pseudovibrio sp. JE062]EEA92586.1 glutathione S-transferase [Pseudovibrio sp. JE062]
MITVHNLENSQSIRILWLLEELGVPYEIKQYKRDATTDLAPADYKKLHRIGTSPTISDGDVVLPETNAIVDYILDKHPNAVLRPEPGSAQRARYLFWFHATQGSFMPLLLDSLIFKRMVSKVPFFLRPIMSTVVGKVRGVYLTPRITRMLSYIEEELGRSTWLAGENLTAADIVMGYCLEVAEVRVGFGGEYPKIAAYLKRMRSRPAYKTALAKNGDFRPFAS